MANKMECVRCGNEHTPEHKCYPAVYGHDSYCDINNNAPCDCYCTDDAAGPRLADCKEVMAATYDLLHKLRCFISDKDEVHEEIGWVLMRLNDVGKLGRPDPERDAGDPRTPEFGVAP